MQEWEHDISSYLFEDGIIRFRRQCLPLFSFESKWADEIKSHTWLLLPTDVIPSRIFTQEDFRAEETEPLQCGRANAAPRSDMCLCAGSDNNLQLHHRWLADIFLRTEQEYSLSKGTKFCQGLWGEFHEKPQSVLCKTWSHTRQDDLTLIRWAEIPRVVWSTKSPTQVKLFSPVAHKRPVT